MTKIIIVQKGGNLVSKNTNQVNESTLYKKCGLKNDDNFDHRHTWQVEEDGYISLYARDDGKANQENKYDLPPPLDNSLFFNKMVLVKHFDKDLEDDNALDLTLDEWSLVYEKLFGGFEDLEDEEPSEEENIPLEFRTKSGYSKQDGFVVDDDDDDISYISSDDGTDNDSVSNHEENSDEEIYLDNESTDNSEIDDNEYNSSCSESTGDSSGNESELTEESYLSD
mgnify:CR=1 FL=1|tara:strand:- start:3743 stop:4417 length:675 start_codon:yes stop_codon:yes gene_type:complete